MPFHQFRGDFGVEECRETLVSALNSFFYIYKDDEEAA